tara:strand:- start:4681 stop:4968 length:288 start_codon:yes stop_codon:yes gene_type:complete
MSAYWIAIYKNLNNPENLKAYAEKATPAIKKHNGKILVRGGIAETIEGESSPRTVIIEFPNFEEALKCYNSKEYQDAKKLVKEGFNRQIQIVEGI